MRRTKLLVGVLVLALVAALVAVVLLWRERGADDEVARGAALHRAEVAAEEEALEAVVRMTTYSYRTVEEDFEWVDEAGTEDFQEYFSGASEDVIRLIKRIKAEATGTVVDSAATAADGTHVKVLLFIDQEITSRTEEGASLDQPRVTMQMVRRDGEWLVDEVQIRNLLGG